MAAKWKEAASQLFTAELGAARERQSEEEDWAEEKDCGSN